MEPERAAALAVRLPRAAGYYGLCGAPCVPQLSNELVGQVARSTGTGPPLTGALAGDEVMIGLAGVFDAAAPVSLGDRSLRFDCAAHGAIESSRQLFRQLSTGVVRLLTCPMWTEEGLAKLVARIR